MFSRQRGQDFLIGGERGIKEAGFWLQRLVATYQTGKEGEAGLGAYKILDA